MVYYLLLLLLYPGNLLHILLPLAFALHLLDIDGHILLEYSSLRFVNGLPGDYFRVLEVGLLIAIGVGAKIVLPDLHNNDLAIIAISMDLNI